MCGADVCLLSTTQRSGWPKKKRTKTAHTQSIQYQALFSYPSPILMLCWFSDFELNRAVNENFQLKADFASITGFSFKRIFFWGEEGLLEALILRKGTD